MPAYSNATPPLALFSPAISDLVSMPKLFPAGRHGPVRSLAVPEPAGFPDQGHTVRWQTIFWHQSHGGQHSPAGSVWPMWIRNTTDLEPTSTSFDGLRRER